MPDVAFPVETFLREYESAHARGEAVGFVGAGLTRGAGLVDLQGLLADFAKELGLDLDIETDLAAVAQYHLNSQAQTRDRQAVNDSRPMRPTGERRISRLASPPPACPRGPLAPWRARLGASP